MKTLPEHWTVGQRAFFAGLISAYVDVRHLKVVIDHLTAITPFTHELFFDQLIAVLEPRIQPARWDGVVEGCERIFA
jgi:hypothetical protein